MFNLSLRTANAAFGENGTHYEVARILREIADDIESSGNLNGSVMDYNGNKVGTYEGE